MPRIQLGPLRVHLHATACDHVSIETERQVLADAISASVVSTRLYPVSSISTFPYPLRVERSME